MDKYFKQSKDFKQKEPVQVKTSGNQFLSNSTKGDTFTENMAVSNSSTGNVLLDDFSKSGSYRARDSKDVNIDSARLWAYSPIDMLKELFYLRMITRKVVGFFPTDEPQRGQGNRDESLRRLLWVAENHPKSFYQNLWLLPMVGSFKDLWTLMAIDVNNVVDHNKVFDVMGRGLSTPNVKDLVIKFMPQIRAKSKILTNRGAIMTELAREFAKYSGITEQEYRKLKVSGNAHKFQTYINEKMFDKLDFNAIPGRALSNLVSGKFLQTHGLEQKYLDWLDTKPTAKFTGYPYELASKWSKNTSLINKHTINKQFRGLLELASEGTGAITGNIWCALDTSGSMTSTVAGDITAYDICISLGIYFSSLNTGAFKDNVIMFDDTSTKMQLLGEFTDKLDQIKNESTAWGSTNFESVVDEIVRIRKQNPSIPIEDYPTTLLVVSDMQFNPALRSGRFGYYGDAHRLAENYNKTNYNTIMAKLQHVGLPAINVIWWQVTGHTKDFPSTIDDERTAMFSGFDGSVITTLLGGDVKEEIDKVTGERVAIDPVESMTRALNQPILKQIKL